jgi:hypothetical protein
MDAFVEISERRVLMTPETALGWLMEDGCVTVRSDGWFYISKPPTKKDLGRFIAAIESLGAWSVETSLSPARVRITRGGIDDRYGLLFKIEERNA